MLKKNVQSWRTQLPNFKTCYRAEARRTTILQPVERKPHSQKERLNEKAEDYAPDEGTR